MILYQTIKRRVVRARKRLDRWIGYGNHNRDEGPSLGITLDQGYEVEISFADLAHLVRKADEVAASEKSLPALKNWRELGNEGAKAIVSDLPDFPDLAEKIYDVLWGARFEEWHNRTFNDHVSGENGCKTKSQILDDIRGMFK